MKKNETLNPGACILKYFMAVINSAQQSVTVSHFRPSLIFGGKAGAYPSGRYSNLRQGSFAFSANISLGWKGLTATKELRLLQN